MRGGADELLDVNRTPRWAAAPWTAVNAFLDRALARGRCAVGFTTQLQTVCCLCLLYGAVAHVCVWLQCQKLIYNNLDVCADPVWQVPNACMCHGVRVITVPGVNAQLSVHT